MTTPPDERFPYAVLARQGARVERRLQPGSLARLEALAPAHGPADVDLVFRQDESGRNWVGGRAAQAVDALCHRCMERFERRLDVTFDLCIVLEGDEASTFAGAVDVLTVVADTLAIADVVEDELLLGLPEQLCLEEPCPFAPALAFPAERFDQTEADQDRVNPFSTLALLKNADS